MSHACSADTLTWGSGGYYIFCQCGRKWVSCKREGPDAPDTETPPRDLFGLVLRKPKET